MKIAFKLNGIRQEVDCLPDRRVVDLLREELGYTGTKEACGSGECGACTILVDGVSKLSCLMLAAQLQGRSITTSEGMSLGKKLHPIQQAFVDKGAVQCGFCSPGMLMATVDFLQRNPAPDRQQIRAALSGNLCRCTGYQKIIDAVERAAAEMRDEL